MGKKKKIAYCELPRENNLKRFFIKKDEIDSELSFNFTIHYAEEVDKPSDYPIDYSERNYVVIFWIDPERVYNTRVVRGSPNPIWKQDFCMVINPVESFGFLNIEVVRLNSRADPGTSTGWILVGRVRIPIPRKICTKSQRYGLVRPEGSGYKPEGHLFVSMETKKIHPW
ncbi:hypothetical protein Pint_06440 [Pistacia integerrima]|uniref:Uncharacterized protein n=1 Tax=Pistacia integerrima TaxID=434235 RepID=A0ACC0Z3G0_9ROSI|nr:hypothetical protein Pint_06440 [Pistacia integerrima]